ncbi:MAG: MFS transporter [Candidatus Bathyarchaeota archaeon]
MGQEEHGRFGFITRNYLVLTLTSALWGIPASICNTYFSLYVFSLGGTEITIGLVVALGNASFVVFAIIGGHIADLYGRKRIVSIMTIFLGLSQFSVALSPNWQFLALAMILTNMLWIFEPAFWALLADSTNRSKRGTAFAFFSCVSFIPWTIMPSIGGFLIDTYGVLTPMRLSYVALGFAGLAAGLIRQYTLKETITLKKTKIMEKIGLREIGILVKNAFKDHIKTWSWMPYSVLALAAIYIIWAFEYGLVEPYWIVYAEQVIGISSTQWGIITAVGSSISIGTKLAIVGRLLDKFSRRKILLAVTALDISTYLLFINCGMFLHVLVLWIMSSFVWAFYEPTYSSLEADMIPEERRGRVFAAFGAAWSAFTVPASLIGGFIYERVSPQLSFIIASAGILVCFILTAIFIKQPKSKE